jgi:hypothetical protein
VAAALEAPSVPRRTRQLPDGSTTGDLGVRDPFELIRHLARSQGDPRKAVAELVQNALDEQATRIVLERTRLDGDSALIVFDDGRGVLPGLERSEALTSIARNIGHSRKRELSFDERMRQAMLGQYGIGLLGFWSLGHELRMISQVEDSEPWVLTLFEDSPRFSVAQSPRVVDRKGTWTEIQVRRLHRPALSSTIGGRLASYLSMELRGQLLRHGTELQLIDRLARGAADRNIVIRPSALAGERLAGLEPIRIEGFQYPVELTLHYAGDAGDDSPRVKLASAGAIVLDDVAQLPELNHAPWTDARLVGVIDFPHLEVPPGSRRGVVPNAASAGLVEALITAEPQVNARLAERSAADAAAISQDLHRQLARLFGRVSGYVPHLTWFPVARKYGLEAAAPEGTAVPAAAAPGERDQGPQPDLFPPGPLSFATFRPAQLELEVHERREVAVTARDAEGRRIDEGVTFEARGTGPISVQHDGARIQLEGVSAGAAQLDVTVRQNEKSVVASLAVDVVLSHGPKRGDSGIPQPEELDDPLQTWRSRLVDDRWQINVGHPDYRALAGEPRTRLRYLASLLSKEVVSRNFPQPGIGAVLEELVGLLAALERSGAWGKTPKKEST